MQKIIAVCDPNERYVDRLGALLEDKLNRGYVVHTFTSAEAILRGSKELPPEMILISESEYDSKLEEITKNIVVLSEDIVSDDDGSSYQIHRYQPVDDILREVICYMSERIGSEQIRIKSFGKMKIIALYSPVGRVLQTTFGQALGQHLAADHKVLFLPLEFYPGEDYSQRMDHNNNLMDLLYYLDCSPERLPLKLPLITQSVNGMDVIPGVCCFDLQERDGKSWLRLIEELQRMDFYDYLIIDLPQCLSGVLGILSASTRIYSISPSDERAQRKRKEFEKWLVSNSYSEVVNKMLSLSFPWFQNLPNRPEDLYGSEIWPYVKAVVREDGLIRTNG